jgi:hypothetical protein
MEDIEADVLVVLEGGRVAWVHAHLLIVPEGIVAALETPDGVPAILLAALLDDVEAAEA